MTCVANGPWKYNIRRNINSDISVVAMRRVASFELYFLNWVW